MFCKFLFGMDTKKVWIISFWYGHCCGRAFGGTDLELYWEGKNYGSVSRIWYLLLSQEELWQRYEELISVTVPEISTYLLTIVLLWYLSPSFDTNCRVFPGCRSFCMHSVPYRAIWPIWYDPRRHLCCHMASLNCHVCGTRHNLNVSCHDIIIHVSHKPHSVVGSGKSRVLSQYDSESRTVRVRSAINGSRAENRRAEHN